MMMDFPYTLKGKAMYWIRRLPTEVITTWELLKKAFLNEYRTPTMIMKQVDAIRKFQQSDDEQLFTAWERLEDAILRCPEHKLNKHEQIQIFYNGLKLDAGRMLDSEKPIPKMTACEGIKRIEEIARHSAMWHEDERSPNKVESMIKNIHEFELEVYSLTKQVKMVEHSFDNPLERRVSNIEKFIRKLMRDDKRKNVTF